MGKDKYEDMAINKSLATCNFDNNLIINFLILLDNKLENSTLSNAGEKYNYSIAFRPIIWVVNIN